MEVAIFSFMGAVLGAILVFVASLFTTFGKSKDTQLDVLTKVITTERAQWRSDMRKLTSELVSLLRREKIKTDDDLIDQFHQTRVKLRLRLNSDEGHALDEKLLASLKVFSNYVTKDNDTFINLISELEKFELTTQQLIKKEWDKSKKEAESGNLGKSDKHT